MNTAPEAQRPSGGGDIPPEIPAPKRVGKFGTGMPSTLQLDLYGELINDAWGQIAYLVGSATQTKVGWRDVDVRLILPDEEYEAIFLHPTVAQPLRYDPTWRAHCLAWSLLGREMTGLPIDFQIQHQSVANQAYDGPRFALGLRLDRVQQLERDRAAKGLA
jgi:hypothetical protein